MALWPAQLQKMKVSTPAEFDALVQKIEVVARRDPAYYRRRLRLLALLGYAYILVVFVLLFSGLWIVFRLLVHFQNGAWYEFIWVVFLLVLGLFSLFFVWVKPPKGVTLTRSQAPQLFAMLDSLSAQLKAPKLNRVILDENLNAAIMQRPKLGIIGWQTNYLLVGLPLMQALSPKQFEAVMAHELAHLCGDDGKTAAWIYRIRRTWYDLAERFERTGGGGLFFKRFFSWYGPFFRAYSFVHARSQEYEADRRAAALVGAKHKAEALIWLNVNSSLLSRQFIPDFKRRTTELSKPPADFVSQMLSALQQPIDSDQSRRWLALHLIGQTNNSSTHPSLAARLAALDYQVPEILEMSDERAIALLGHQLEELTTQLNTIWQKESALGWQDSYEQGQRLRDRLYTLNKKADEEARTKPEALTPEEKIKRVSLTWTIGDKQVLSMLREIVKETPAHVAAHYWLGYVLSEPSSAEVNKECIVHLEFVINHDPSLLISACHHAYSFYLKQQQLSLAESYKQRWQQHEKVWNLVLAERADLDDKAHFISHDLPTVEIQQMAAQFATYPEVGAVYLVRYVDERLARQFPGHACYVMAITRRYYSGMGKNYKTDSKLQWFIESEIAFSNDYIVRFITQAEQWPRLRKIEAALIYSA